MRAVSRGGASSADKAAFNMEQSTAMFAMVNLEIPEARTVIGAECAGDRLKSASDPCLLIPDS